MGKILLADRVDFIGAGAFCQRFGDRIEAWLRDEFQLLVNDYPTQFPHSAALNSSLASVFARLARSLSDETFPQVGYDGGDSLCADTSSGGRPRISSSIVVG